MGTRSTIGILNTDGTVHAIYCHWDGYYSHNGRILWENYVDEPKVRELIALGALSSLGENIGEKHNFNNAPDDQCNAYGRDRGETDVDASVYESEAKFWSSGQEYNYLYKNGSWYADGGDYDKPTLLEPGLWIIGN